VLKSRGSRFEDWGFPLIVEGGKLSPPFAAPRRRFTSPPLYLAAAFLAAALPRRRLSSPPPHHAEPALQRTIHS
jgi:hypothetical protein